jgi:hypothetical protein
MIILIGPFASTAAHESKHIALSFERAMKKRHAPKGGLHGRVLTLHKLLCSPRGVVNEKVQLRDHLHQLQVRTTLSWPRYCLMARTKKRPRPAFPEGLVCGFNFPSLPPGDL